MTRITLDLSVDQAERLRQALGMTPAGSESKNASESNSLVEIARTLDVLVNRLDKQLAESGGKIGQTAQQLKGCKEQHQILTLLGALIVNANSLRESVHESGAELKRTQAALDEVRHELGAAKNLLATDPDTGLPNARAFVPMVNDAILHVAGDEHRLCVAVLEITGMEDVGEDNLPGSIEHVIGLLRSALRREDALVRARGAEFAIMFPHSDIRGANFVVLRIKQLLERTPWKYETGVHTFGIRAGIAQLKPGEGGPALISRARDLLKRQVEEGVGVAAPA